MPILIFCIVLQVYNKI